MGHIRTLITLRNPRRPDLGPLTVEALVDTGAITLCIPQEIAGRLQLDPDGCERRKASLADGRPTEVPYAGPVAVSFGNRTCYGGTLIMGNEVLLGAVQMEDLDLIIVPAHRRVVVNPASPDFPSALVKRQGRAA
jgi:clan AA aspartic protease